MAGALHIGDAVRRYDDVLSDPFVEIVDVDYVPGAVQTYNLSDVENGNTYFADGKLAHNKKKKKKNK